MSINLPQLSDSDIRLLAMGGAPEARALVAHRLCRRLDRAELTDEGRATARQIIRLLAGEEAKEVRRALAVTLRASPLTPRDVANRLARDEASIAGPMLGFSPALTDDDLIELVETGGPLRQLAIARRAALSESVAAAIADFGAAEAVEAACRNGGAVFSLRALTAAVERFKGSEAVLDAIALERPSPSSAAGEPTGERVVTLGDRDGVTLDLVEQARRASDLPAFVAHLRRGERLTASLMLRALASGQTSLFERGLAELSGVPHHRAWLMAHEAGELGLKAICERAGLPETLLPAFQACLEAYRETDLDGAEGDLERFQRRVLERVLSQPVSMPREDVDYLLAKLDHLCAPTAGAEPEVQAA